MWPEESSDSFTYEKFGSLCRWAYGIGASDILLETDDNIYIKLNDKTLCVSNNQTSYDEITVILREIYQQSAPDELRSARELNFPFALLLEDDSLLRFRVNATSVQGAYAEHSIEIVLRTIKPTPPTLEELGTSKEIVDLMHNKAGLVLITGPTGSGKSTLAASLLTHASEIKEGHIITFEAPIEYDLRTSPNRKSKVVQSEIPKDLPDFVTATANSLRRAPDIIFFGELKEKASMSGCLLAAQADRLVLATLHTNSVDGTISRMAFEYDPSDRKNISAKIIGALRGIIHQRLYPCRKGGLICIQSTLIITEKMRRHMLAELLHVDDIAPTVTKLLEAEGKPLMKDVVHHFEHGNMDLSLYLSTIAEVGDSTAISNIPRQIEELGSSGHIDNATKMQWLRDIGLS